MDGCSPHFAVHLSISLSAKIHLDVMIEEGAPRSWRPWLLAGKIKWPEASCLNVLTASWRLESLTDFSFGFFGLIYQHIIGVEGVSQHD